MTSGSGEIALQRAGPSDVATLTDLARQHWIPAFSSIFTPEELEHLFRGMYAPAKLRCWLSKPENHYFIVMLHGAAVGYCAIRFTEPYALLDKLYVSAAEQRKGLGTHCLAQMATLATESGARGLELYVNRRNKKAIEFYLARGFEVVATSDRPAGHTYVYDDYIMRLSF